MQDFARLAIQSALAGNWEKAIEFNQQILASDPKNAPALTRLAFAYLQNGNCEQAVVYYKQVLQLEPNYPVAEKNLARAQKLLHGAKIEPKTTRSQANAKPDVFVNEPGKTRQVNLVNTAVQSVLNRLCVGQEVNLIVKKKALEIRTTDEEEYVGALPDDIGFELRHLCNSGSRYVVYIKNIELAGVSVFIREIDHHLP